MKRALLLLLAVPLALAGCGGGDALSISAVANAADRTVAQKSAKFDMSIQLTVPGAEQPLRMFANGAFDEAGKRARMELDMTEMLSAFGAPVAGSLKMAMLFDETTLYMRLPPEAMAEVRAPTPWVSIDLAKMQAAGGGSFGQFTQSPADMLEVLRTISGSIEKRGTRDIRGVPTTHYHAKVDVSKAVDEGLKSMGGAQMKEMLDQALQDTGLQEIPLDVWIDDKGVLHRMVMDMTMSMMGQSLRMVMTMDLYDFGVQVDVTPPPASQVTDVTAQALAQGS